MRKPSPLGYFLLFHLLSSTVTWAQLPGMIHYGVKDGLPSTTVYSVSQDIEGFIWLGTEAGLVRFDGSEFKTYSTKDGLPDNEVLEVCPDSLDRVWITTYNRNICYLKNGKIYTAKNDSLLKAISDLALQDIISVFPGLGNRSWFYAQKLLRISGNRIFQFPQFTGAQQVKWVEDIDSNNFNVYSNNAVYQFKNDSLIKVRELVTTMAVNTSFGVYGNQVYIFFGDSLNIFERSGDFNFTLRKGFYLKGNSFSQNSRRGNTIFTLNGKILVSAVNLGTYLIENPLSTDCRISLLPNHSTTLFQDRDENLWIATADNGIFFCQPENSLVIDHSNGLKDENAGCIAVDNFARIWIGDAKGSIQCFNNGHVEAITGQKPVTPYSKSRKIIYQDGVVYFISDEGCFIYNTIDKTIINIPVITSCKSLTVSKKRNKLVIGTVNTVLFVDMAPPFHTKEVRVKHRLTAVCEDTAGTLYFGSIDGLYTYCDSLHFTGNSNELLKKRITCMALAKDNTIWIGTSSNGIIAYRNGKVISNISHETNEPFSGVICRSVFVDQNNNCWAATNNGLNRIEYENKSDTLLLNKITPYFTRDGLADDDVNDVCVRDSMVYAATAKGISVFNLNRVTNNFAPVVYITGVAINNRDTLIVGAYTLPYYQNNISIRFTAISFTSNSKIRYRYKLLGSNDTWSFTSANLVELKSLKNGTYTFVIEALDKYGNPTGHPAEIEIQIRPPFYLKWWFIGFLAIVFAFAVYLITNWWLNRSRKNEKALLDLKQKIKKLEQQALRAQMNPHFIFNSLTAIQHFINAEDIETANTYLVSFAKLIRKTLDNSESAVISVAREIEYLENYIHLEQMRFNNKFTYRVTCAPEVNQAKTFIPVMLTQPFVENAIRHGLRHKEGKDGFLSVKFLWRNGHLVCEIEDNGIGRPATEALKTNMHIEYQSKGMKISQERIIAMNDINAEKIGIEIIDKKMTSDISAGTLIILSFG